MKFVLNFSFLNPILSCVRNGYLHLSLYLLERCLSVLKTHECITVLAINQDWMFIAGPRRKCISGINRMVWENVSLRKFVFTGAKSEYHSTFSVKSSFFFDQTGKTERRSDCTGVCNRDYLVAEVAEQLRLLRWYLAGQHVTVHKKGLGQLAHIQVHVYRNQQCFIHNCHENLKKQMF